MAIDAFQEGVAAASEVGQPVSARLIASGAVRGPDVLRVVAAKLDIEFFDPTFGFTPDPAAIGRLEVEVAMAHSALPIRVEIDRLVVAVPDPLDDAVAQALADASGMEVVLALGPADALAAAVRRVYASAAPVEVETAEPAPVLELAPEREPVGEIDAPGYHVNELLDQLLEVGGSDLHLTAGSPPQLRLNGTLQEMEGYAPLLPADLRTLVYSILTARQREELEEELELDASHPLPGRGRFRVNVFFQRGSVGAVMRAIPNDPVSLDELGMPKVLHQLTTVPRGLVLVTGATGSGKSTTLASMIDEINTARSVHVMTVEDPIEFMHRHKRSIVNQREVGADTTGFAAALKHALRQDPDVILVGEMRDLETIATALTAAETGHLVFATLHTQDAPGSVERVIDVFPPHQQQQVRVQLAESLQAVITQQLLPTVDGQSRVPAVEVMIATPAIRNLIREGKVPQIRSSMQAGGRHGMQTMDQALAGLVRAGKIDMKIATERAQNVEEFMNLVGGVR